MNKIIYLDAAASSLKPAEVIRTQDDFLTHHYANAGRGVCARSMAVDNTVNLTRERVARFINSTPDNIVFTSGTTDGMNRISRILERSNVFTKESIVVVSDLDHHSARLPWEEMASLDKCKIKTSKLDDNFNIDLSGIDHIDIFVITAMSNVLGRRQDVKKLIKDAKSINPNVISIIDAAQYVAHLPIDVADWGCDFLCFSGHKIGADTGIGIMYVKEPLRWQVDNMGGGMIATVTEKQNKNAENATSTWVLADGPERFEAGTLPLTQIAGLGPAIDYLENHRPDPKLIRYLHGELSKIKDITLFTKPDDALLTFFVEDMHCFDFGSLIGAHGVCLRVG
ncbi:MAG: aminotransferase class V-fold PLP-dependent enzyme, partial [Rickettsiales bacterium]|nr:aminotransferase class V-fold PLP-dependent enzyme [Rickettsiales bacterium]